MRRPIGFASIMLCVLGMAATTTRASDHDWQRLTPPRVDSHSIATFDLSHDRAIIIPTSNSPSGESWHLFNLGAGPWFPVEGSGDVPDPTTVRACFYVVNHGFYVFARRPEDPPYGPGQLAIWSIASKGVGAWSRVAVSGNAPADRSAFSLVLDTRRERLLLFGGGESSDQPTFADTWALDFDAQPMRWTRLAVPAEPPERAGMAAAYDSVGDRLVVFGGSKRFASGAGISGMSDFWALRLGDAPGWDSLAVAGDPPPFGSSASLAAIPGSDRLLVCGRRFDEDHLALWSLDLAGNGALTRLADAPATGVSLAVRLLASTREQKWYVLAGGTNSWTFDLARPADWTLRNAPFANGPEGDPQFLVSDPVTHTCLATENFGYIQVGDAIRRSLRSDLWRLTPSLPPRWELVGGAGIGPDEFGCLQRVYDSRRERWLLFGFAGTFDGYSRRYEAWSLSVGPQPRWSRLVTEGVVPAHPEGSALAYDTLRDRIVSFGGGSGLATSDVNVLELSGTPRWHSIPNAGHTPRARYGAMLVWDPPRDRLLLFGGAISRQTANEPEITSFNDAWALHVGEQAVWDSLAIPGQPPAGQANSLGFYDPARDALDIFAGVSLGAWSVDPGLQELGLAPAPDWLADPTSPASAPPLLHLGAVLQLLNAFDGGLDRVVSLRDGHQLWVLDRGQPTHVALLDLEPGDATNTLRADAHGNVTAAILGDAAFDAATVDPASVTLAGARARQANAADRATLRDVNRDGRVDRVLTFARADMVLDPSVDVVALTGRTKSGDAVMGWDLYRVGDGNGRGVDAGGIATTGDPDSPVTAPTRLGLTIAGPVRGAAYVHLAVPKASPAGNALEIYSVDGRRVARRDLGALAAGDHALALDETRGLAPGVYFARVRVGGAAATAKFVALP